MDWGPSESNGNALKYSKKNSALHKAHKAHKKIKFKKMGFYVECTVECRIESTTVNTNKQRCAFALLR